MTLMASTTEVYSRYAVLDIHVESEADSVPSSLSCSIIASSDGKSFLLKKLMTGSTTVITCSTTIHTRCLLDPSSKCQSQQLYYYTDSTQLFLRTEEVERLKEVFIVIPITFLIFIPISCLRQLFSSFNKLRKLLGLSTKIATNVKARLLDLYSY
ncbi:hypothetical protein BD770DRAFT_405749 [Pilaira anomala]|nr:hypothetical protein BD770DRAFT_405749 [Pilaira anomala]